MTTRILRLPDVIKTTGLSRSSLYAFVKARTFPKPILLGMRAVGWIEEEVINWIDERLHNRKSISDGEAKDAA